MIGVVNVKSSCINIIPERALSVKVKLFGSQSQHGKLHRNEMWKKVASLKHMGIVFYEFSRQDFRFADFFGFSPDEWNFRTMHCKHKQVRFDLVNLKSVNCVKVVFFLFEFRRQCSRVKHS